jgi:hypothetical protein
MRAIALAGALALLASAPPAGAELVQEGSVGEATGIRDKNLFLKNILLDIKKVFVYSLDTVSLKTNRDQ